MKGLKKMKKFSCLVKALWLGEILFLLGVVLLCSNVQVEAAKKGTVYSKLKKGTLTISGKGKMPASMTFHSKKIKKIVVKKGVTSISEGAFSGCGKVKEIQIAKTVKKIGQAAFFSCNSLKKLTLPGNFTYVERDVEDEVCYDLTYNSNNIDTIQFNTPLKLENVAFLRCKNLLVSKKDKAFKSIHGVIYSKDGKSIVRVPMMRTSVTLEPTCEEFCLQSVLYCTEDFESEPIGGCVKLRKIVIPSSVKSVNTNKYYAFSSGYGGYRVRQLVIQTQLLSAGDLQKLRENFSGAKENMLAF